MCLFTIDVAFPAEQESYLINCSFVVTIQKAHVEGANPASFSSLEHNAIVHVTTIV